MLLIFFGVFFLTGITFFGVLIAFAVVFIFSIVVGLLGAAFNLLPYILFAILAYWVIKRVSVS
jgi:phage shock protein G